MTMSKDPQETNQKIKETFVKKIVASQKIHPNFEPILIMSDNGHYYAHNFTWNQTIMVSDQHDNLFNTGNLHPLCFSPDNKYCILENKTDLYFYNIIQKNRICLTNGLPDMGHKLAISNDSKHILFDTRDTTKQNSLMYKLLWTLDDRGRPQLRRLNNNLYSSAPVIFFPDNQHIIHVIHDKCGEELYLYNLETGKNNHISSLWNDGNLHIDTLTVTADNKRIIVTPVNKYHNNLNILVNIEDLGNITTMFLPEQICGKIKVPQVYIPHKKMFTRILSPTNTLYLFAENTTQPIATHTTEKGVNCTALAVDNSGNYLAAGYSNGTVMIWNLLSANPEEFKKIFIKNSDRYIESLIFSDNQLLLTQTESCPEIREGKWFWYNWSQLWNMHGNRIIDFGYTIKCTISSDEKIILAIEVVDNDKRMHDSLNLTTYHLTDQTLLDAQQLIYLPCNQ